MRCHECDRPLRAIGRPIPDHCVNVSQDGIRCGHAGKTEPATPTMSARVKTATRTIRPCNERQWSSRRLKTLSAMGSKSRNRPFRRAVAERHCSLLGRGRRPRSAWADQYSRSLAVLHHWRDVGAPNKSCRSWFGLTRPSGAPDLIVVKDWRTPPPAYADARCVVRRAKQLCLSEAAALRRRDLRKLCGPWIRAGDQRCISGNLGFNGGDRLVESHAAVLPAGLARASGAGVIVPGRRACGH